MNPSGLHINKPVAAVIVVGKHWFFYYSSVSQSLQSSVSSNYPVCHSSLQNLRTGNDDSHYNRIHSSLIELTIEWTRGTWDSSQWLEIFQNTGSKELKESMDRCTACCNIGVINVDHSI